MPEEIDEVMESYHRCRRSEGFIDTFYELFLGKSPKISAMFANTNFKIQKLMLRESLLEMLCLEQGVKGSREEIDKLGKRHKDLKVEPEMYAMWLDSLCEAIQQHDAECTPEILQQWRQSMQAGIDVMISA